MTEADDSTESESRLENVPWRRVASVLGVLILVAVLIPFVVFAVPQTVGADQSYVVTSGSMEPNISLGSAVIVKQVPTERIQVNDVITFQSGDDPRTTTHRVIEVTEQDGQRAFRTKGDANEDPDQSLVVPGQNARVEGRVMTVAGHLFAIPLIGYAITFMNTQTGFTALVAVPFVLLIANEVWNVIASVRTKPADGSESDSPEADAEAAEPAAVATADAEGDATETTDKAETAVAEESEEDAGITLRATELRLAIMSVGAFLAYSVWVAYATTEFWSFAVAAGVGTAFVLLTGLYLAGRRGSGEDEASGETAPEESGATTEGDDTEATDETSTETDTEENVLDPEEIVSPVDSDDTVTGIQSELEDDPLLLIDDAVLGDEMTADGAGETEQGTAERGEEQPGD